MAAIQSLLSQSFSDLTKAGRKDGVSDQQRMRDALRSTLVEGRHRLESVFEAWDQNGNGSVDRMEFRHAMRALGFRASACDATEEQVDGWIDELFREFDDDGGGTVNYRELEKKLAKIKGAAVEQRYVVRSKSGGRIGAALGTSVRLDRASGKPVAVLLSEELAKGSALVRVMDLFRDWDENGDGYISKVEFFQALVALGYDITRQEASEVFDSFDNDGSGKIDFREMNKLLRRRSGPLRSVSTSALPSLSRDPLAQGSALGSRSPLMPLRSTRGGATSKSMSSLPPLRNLPPLKINAWNADRMNMLCSQWLAPRHGAEWLNQPLVAVGRPPLAPRRTALDPAGVMWHVVH